MTEAAPIAAPDPPFTFSRRARSRVGLITLTLVWATLLAAWALLDAAPAIIGFLGLFTLPIVWDLWRDPQSGLSLSETELSWYSGRRQVTLEPHEISYVRLDTRLDFSVRATAVLRTGRKIRVPFESTPPHQAFEDALTACGIATQRHHFTLMQ